MDQAATSSARRPRPTSCSTPQTRCIGGHGAPEALAEAKRRDCPILLSIGYAACHWCHVMAHESFEDAETASLMNELFVNVKVDREERPDIDHIYMTALHAHGRAGRLAADHVPRPRRRADVRRHLLAARRRAGAARRSGRSSTRSTTAWRDAARPRDGTARPRSPGIWPSFRAPAPGGDTRLRTT